MNEVKPAETSITLPCKNRRTSLIIAEAREPSAHTQADAEGVKVRLHKTSGKAENEFLV
jgi:hypothetical protein